VAQIGRINEGAYLFQLIDDPLLDPVPLPPKDLTYALVYFRSNAEGQKDAK
jgi:hypothetical protein